MIPTPIHEVGGKKQQQNIIATTIKQLVKWQNKLGIFWNGAVTGQNYFQVNIFQPRLILNFLSYPEGES